MKIIYYFILPLMASCSTNVGTGIIAGGTIGASLGGITNGSTGALVGSTACVIAGGVIGAALDQQDRKVMEKSSPRTVTRMDKDEPLTINDVIKLSQSGICDDTVITYIKQRKTIYSLTQAQTRRMQEAGVSQRVINFMIESGKLPNAF
jgi:uncharacterized protein YcfJ